MPRAGLPVGPRLLLCCPCLSPTLFALLRRGRAPSVSLLPKQTASQKRTARVCFVTLFSMRNLLGASLAWLQGEEQQASFRPTSLTQLGRARANAGAGMALSPLYKPLKGVWSPVHIFHYNVGYFATPLYIRVWSLVINSEQQRKYHATSWYTNKEIDKRPFDPLLLYDIGKFPVI